MMRRFASRFVLGGLAGGGALPPPCGEVETAQRFRVGEELQLGRCESAAASGPHPEFASQIPASPQGGGGRKPRRPLIDQGSAPRRRGARGTKPDAAAMLAILAALMLATPAAAEPAHSSAYDASALGENPTRAVARMEDVLLRSDQRYFRKWQYELYSPLGLVHSSITGARQPGHGSVLRIADFGRGAPAGRLPLS